MIDSTIWQNGIPINIITVHKNSYPWPSFRIETLIIGNIHLMHHKVSQKNISINIITVHYNAIHVIKLWKSDIDHYPWRVANFDLYSALTASVQWGFLNVPHSKCFNLSQHFFFVSNLSESPFLEVCKLTDLMAVKVGRFTDLGAVLVEYYRAKSPNG